MLDVLRRRSLDRKPWLKRLDPSARPPRRRASKALSLLCFA
jgi:hypothetical protein